MVVGFSALNYTVLEEVGAVSIQILKFGLNEREVTVQIATREDSALGKPEYNVLNL